MVMKDREMPLSGAPLYFTTSSAATPGGAEKFEPNNWDLIRPVCHCELLQDRASDILLVLYEINFFRRKTGFKLY